MTASPPRRRFLARGGMLAAGAALPATATSTPAPAQAAPWPAVAPSERERPQLPSGLQIGDVTGERAIIWSRTDRTAQMMVDYDTSAAFTNPRRVAGPVAGDATDFTTRVDLTGLPPGRQVFVRVRYVDVHNPRIASDTLTAQFRTAPAADGRRAVRFHWSGDQAGQGWGINHAFGGVKIYEAMRLRDPDFFIHNGDTIYADGPIAAEATAEDGRIWTSLVTEEVSKVAETLKEYRGRHAYNMLDLNFRRFAAQVPQIWQWDDHEVTNNYSAAKDLSADPRYTEKDVAALTRRGRRAFLEYAPMRYYKQTEPQRIYRRLAHGPLLDVFVVDMRSYRGPNSANLQPREGADAAFLGAAQVEWLIASLTASRATWKVIAADMPIGLQVPDGKDAAGMARWEALANGEHGLPLGRELEMARLLSAIKAVPNVVWITTDVHYCAAHYYDPAQAAYTDFAPFWEFVAGPMHAGSYGPNPLDRTFGPTVVFSKAPLIQNSSPYAGFQFFGEVRIDPQSKALTVELLDLNGASQFTKTLTALAV